MGIETHPTVVKYNQEHHEPPSEILDAKELREFLLSVGADDVGFVSVDRPDVASELPYALKAFPRARTYVSIICRLNREPIRTEKRSASNLEFHHVIEKVNEVARDLVRHLENKGIRALNPAGGFPMEMDDYPGRIWVVSHKPIAVAAGLGHMGLHRNVIHKKFGNFISLGTVILESKVSEESKPIDFNPCIDCKLCSVVCPVGAISPDGKFNFSTCMTHNYHEFMGGFNRWVETIADSKNAKEYSQRVTPSETASMWQSLSFGANYKAAYCLAVCPAGEDVIGQFLKDRKGFFEEVVKPLQDKPETIYVAANSDATEHVKKLPNKRAKFVRSGLKPKSIEMFLGSMPRVFQSSGAEGLNARYHFRFTGSQSKLATIEIFNKELTVYSGLLGKPDITITVDGDSWIKMLNGDAKLPALLLTRKLVIKGNPKLLMRFEKCFPG